MFPASMPGNCTKDTDCKGERICERGQCAPPASTTPDAPSPGVFPPAAEPVTPPPTVTWAPPARPDDASAGATQTPAAAPSADDHHRTLAPVRFGVGFDLGGAGLGSSGGPVLPGFVTTLGLGVSGGHFGGVVAIRAVLGDWLVANVDLLGRYYLLNGRSSPFVSLAFMPWMTQLATKTGPGYEGTTGVGAGFELGEEIFRAADAGMVRFKARVDFPFFSARDSGGDLRSFWVGSLAIEFVATKMPDNFWML